MKEVQTRMVNEKWVSSPEEHEALATIKKNADKALFGWAAGGALLSFFATAFLTSKLAILQRSKFFQIATTIGFGGTFLPFATSSIHSYFSDSVLAIPNSKLSQ